MKRMIDPFMRTLLLTVAILASLVRPAQAIDPDRDDPADIERKLRNYARTYLEKSPLRVFEISKAIGAPITLLAEDVRFTRSGGRPSITWAYSSSVTLSDLQARTLRDQVEELIAAIALSHPTETVQLLTQDAWSQFYLSLNPRPATRAVFVVVKPPATASYQLIPEPVSLAPVYPFWAGGYGYHVGLGYQPFFTPVAALSVVPVRYAYPYYIPWASPYVIPFPGYLPLYYYYPYSPVVYRPYVYPVAVTPTVSVSIASDRPGDFASLLGDARKRMSRNDLAGAVESLALAVEKDSQSPVAWYLKAAAEYQLGRSEDAKESALRARACEMVEGVSSAEIAIALEKVQGTPRMFLERTAYPDTLARAKEIASRPLPRTTASAKK